MYISNKKLIYKKLCFPLSIPYRKLYFNLQLIAVLTKENTKARQIKHHKKTDAN